MVGLSQGLGSKLGHSAPRTLQPSQEAFREARCMPDLFRVGMFHSMFTSSLYARPIPGTGADRVMMAEGGQFSQPP